MGTYIVDYRSIELAVGLRHYFFLSDKSKIFINAAFLFDFPIKSYTNYSRTNIWVFINYLNSNSLGIGYNYNNKYSIEFKYRYINYILNNYSYLFPNHNYFSLMFGYRIK